MARLANWPRTILGRLSSMGHKCTKAEVEHRVHKISRMILMCSTRSQIQEFARNEWGVSRSQIDIYIERARRIIREDYSVDRMDFIASRLGTLDRIVQESMKRGQHSNAIGAIRLAAELTQTLTKR